MKLVFIISFVAFTLILQAQNAGDFRLTVEIVQVCGYQDTDIDTGEDYRWQFWSRNESETQFYKSTIIGKDEMIAGTCLNADNPNTFGPPLPYTVYNGIHNSSNKSEFLVYLQVAGYEKDCFADNSHNGDNLTYKPTCYCGLLGTLRCQDKDDDNYALSSLTPVRVNLNELVPGAYSPIQTIDITVNGVRKYSVNYRYRFTPPVPETVQLLAENTVCSGDNYTLKLNYSYPVKQIKWYENINYQQVKVIDGLDYQCVYPGFLDCNNCSGPECQACICQECLFNNPEEDCYQSCQSCVISHYEYVWQEVGSTNVPELTLTAPATNSDQNFRQYRAVIIGENNEYSLGPSQPGAITTVLRGPALLKEYVYNGASLLLPEDVNQIHPGIEIQHVSCFLEKTGSISITGLDNSLSGNGIYNFRLYNGTEIGSFLNITQVSDTNPVVFEGLASGNYQLRIINSLNGGEYCFSEYTISIRQPGAPLSALSVNPNDVGRNGYSISCFGNADGELIIETHGGLGAYSYLFNDQLYDSGYFEGLSKGTYSFQIQDEVGCTEIFQTEITSPEILEFTDLPGGILQSVDYEYHIRCFGEFNGEITGTLFGGIPPYQVLLSQESSAFEATSETNGPIWFSELGAGNYTVIATDKNGCTILEEAISLLQPPPLTAEIQEIQPPVCPGGNDGKFTVKISGNVGIPRLQLEGKTLSGSQVEFTNLMAGNYLLEFQDEFQCSQTLPVSIPDNPKPLNINILEVIPPVCPGTASGKVILMGENGSFQSEKDLYTFKIPFHEDVISSQGIPATIDGLLAGIHRITVYDTHDPSCQYSVQVEIPSMRPDPLTVIIEEIIEPLCFDSSDGRVKLSVSGGDAPYFFHLEDSTSVEITGSLFEINQLSRNEQGYTLYVYDKNHLIWPESCTVSVVLPIHTPQPVSANYTLSPPSCFGESDGKIQVAPTGGTAPYNIRWPGSALESPLLSGIPSGQYEVSITDSNQCTFVEIITLNDPLPLEFEKINTQNPSCSEAANGWIWMSARGGNGYISYKLNENESFFGYFKDLTTGNYTLTATDENGCQVTQIVELLNEIPQFDIVKTPPLCAEGFGRIDITVPNNFQAKEFILDSIKQPHGYFDQIPEGEHLLKITDATGCAFEEIVNLTIPNKLVASVRTLTPSECGISNGQAMAIIEKGLPPYKIYWKTLSGETVSPNQLSEGDYKVYIIDNNLCQLQLNYHQPSVSTLLAEATILQPADSEGKNGSVQLKILGGSGNYQVNWSSGFGNTLNSNLSAGQGEAIISDLTTSCETTVSFFIEKTPPLSYESLVKNPSCGQYDGNIELMVSGGTAPYLIEWESG
ncbi:MAG: SprB repeat-containing protein, partial [Cyclobacteriaceae bacterium]|nr:SprB repeat-containing protein [Cyclobacteriaceae bacterium]